MALETQNEQKKESSDMKIKEYHPFALTRNINQKHFKNSTS